MSNSFDLGEPMHPTTDAFNERGVSLMQEGNLSLYALRALQEAHVAALLTQDRQHMEQQEAAVAAARTEEQSKRLVHIIFHSPDTGPKAFALVREHDVSGVSGTGTVAYGVEFPDGTVALRWVGGNPTSVVFHDNGMESVEAIHGHGGNTRIVWLSEDLGPRAAEMDECEQRGREQGQRDAEQRIREGVEALDAKACLSLDPIDCNYSCNDGDCTCSGIRRVRAWTLDPAAVLAVIDGSSDE